MSLMATIAEIEDGLWLRRGESGKRRTVAIVGGMHGNETAGAAVVEELLATDHPVWQVCRDEVWLCKGSPPALAANTRGTAPGRDLNRLFGLEIPEGDDFESSRARALRKWLKPVEVLLDLHQTVKPTPPLAVVKDTPRHLALVRRLGVPLAVVGAEAVYGETMLRNLIDRSGGDGVTVETGQIGTPRALETARTVAIRFLTGEAPAATPLNVVEIVQAIECPGPGLRFSRPLANFTEVRAGEVIGTYDGGGELRIPRGGVAFLPREDVAPGAPCLLIAKERGSA